VTDPSLDMQDKIMQVSHIYFNNINRKMYTLVSLLQPESIIKEKKNSIANIDLRNAYVGSQ
jgi:hypothetical protein